MAIGDSNTYGFGEAAVVRDGAWRYYFGSGIVPYLKANPNWVGGYPALGNGTSGNKMLGYIGQRVDTILNSYDAANQFLYNRPDLAIFMIGVNDCNQIYTGAWVGGTIAISIANLSTLLDNYRTACPKGIALVSKLPPSTTTGVNDNIVLWNAALDVMMASRSDLDYTFTVDLYTAFTNNASWSTDYMWNFLHYNSVGQQLIANTFISTLNANVTTMPRATASPRRSIKPYVAALRYTASTATTLGTGTTLDSTLPWAVSFDINTERSSANSSILCFKTDQATPFVFYTVDANLRYLEFGSSANFNKFFPPSTAAGDIRAVLKKGWHNVVVTFNGVDRKAASSYQIYVDSVNYTVTSGSGLASSTNQNAIGAAVASLPAGTFDMADLTIWNGGTTMTSAQVLAWYTNYTLPSGPTLIRRYQHADASGSTLTDTTGNQNGTIGTATWVSNYLPNIKRTAASTRTLASARTLAS